MNARGMRDVFLTMVMSALCGLSCSSGSTPPGGTDGGAGTDPGAAGASGAGPGTAGAGGAGTAGAGGGGTGAQGGATNESAFVTLRGQVFTVLDGTDVPLPSAVATLLVDGAEPAVATADSTGMFAFEVERGASARVVVSGPRAGILEVDSSGVYGTTELSVSDAQSDLSLFPRILAACEPIITNDQVQDLRFEACGAGGRVEADLPTGALVNDKSAAPNLARVRVAVLDPAHPRTWESLPESRDDLEATTQRYILGGIEIHAEDAITGETLNVAPGKQVVLRVPIMDLPDGFTADDVRWAWFEPETASWVNEGTPTLVQVGDQLMAQYTTGHFSTAISYVPTPVDRGCLRVRPRRAALAPRVCTTYRDCPYGPHMRHGDCVDGVCGCFNDYQCRNDERCEASRCVPAPACSVDADCRLGHDGHELRCVENRCGCSRDQQCRGDERCGSDGHCWVSNISLEVSAGGPRSKRLRGGDECHFVPHDVPLSVTIRYVNSLAIAAATQPVFEWTNRVPITRPAQTLPRPGESFCSTADDCSYLIDVDTGDPPVLLAQQRTCVRGQLAADCGENCIQPIEGTVQLRDDTGAVVGVGTAVSGGAFCATTFATGERQSLVQGPYPNGNHYVGTLTASGPGGAACDPNPVAAPATAQCTDVGTVYVEHHGGRFVDLPVVPRFTPSFTRIRDADGSVSYDLELDASLSGGRSLQYQWEIHQGLKDPWLRDVSPTSEGAVSTFRLETGDYIVKLTIRDIRGVRRSTTQRVVLRDQVLIPRTFTGLGCDLPTIPVGSCVDNRDCPIPGTRCIESSIEGQRSRCEASGQRGFASCSDDNVPWFTAWISEFFIDRTEVTQADFAQCVAAGGCNEPPDCAEDSSNTSQRDAWNPELRSGQPVTCVTWGDARAYCQWRGLRLPTEFEWELAARGDHHVLYDFCPPQEAQPPDEYSSTPGCEPIEGGYYFPWGQYAPVECSLSNTLYSVADAPELDEPVDFAGSCRGAVVPVGRHVNGGSFYGVLDMAGNVSEWTNDRYSAERYVELGKASNCSANGCDWQLGRDVFGVPDPKGPGSGTLRVTRGGSTTSETINEFALFTRGSASPLARSPTLGFRCAFGEQGEGDAEDCEVRDGADDCNGDGIRDSCEVRMRDRDCDGDGVVDVCEENFAWADCNGNNLLDFCEIELGISRDGNDNGVPDYCEVPEGIGCSDTMHDDGIGACVPLGECATDFELQPDGRCVGWVATLGGGPTGGGFASAPISPVSVLVAGGFAFGESTPRASAWRLDLLTMTWVPTAPMNVARGRTTAVPLGDGRILIPGGRATPDVVTNSVEIYDPNANTWTQVQPMNIPRMDAGVTRLGDGRILVAGGLSSTESSVNRWDAEIYNPLTNDWVFAGGEAGMPNSGVGTAKPVADGNALVILSSTAYNGNNEAISWALVYDVDTDSWSDTGFPSGRRHSKLTGPWGGTAYALGGLTSMLSSVSTVSAYIDGTWQTRAALPALLYPEFTTLPDERILGVSTVFADVQASLYDPSSNTWTTLVHESSRREGSIGLINYGPGVVIIGGVDPLNDYEPVPPRVLVFGQ